MRTLRSIRTVNPTGGGPIEGIKQVARVHQAAGHETEIVSLDAPDDAWVTDCPVTVHALGPVRSGYGYTGRLVPWLLEHRRTYDAVVVSGLWQYSSFGVWRALRGTDTPYFVFPHGMLDPWFKRAYPLKHLKKWLYWPWGDYRVLRDARAVLFTCEEERLLARQSFWLYRCREQVVNYGTKAPEGDPETQKAAFFARFPHLEGRQILLFLSRIHEKKGCDLLIRAFAELAARAAAGEPWHLVLAGPCADSAYLTGLQHLAATISDADSVSFVGMLSGDVKWGAFRAADAFVLPSHQENFGIAVAEALACGLPVLISDKVNIWREIKAAGAGLIDEDTQAGAQSLLDAWAELAETQKSAMRTAARTCFHSHFSIRAVADSLLTVIQSSLQRG